MDRFIGTTAFDIDQIREHLKSNMDRFIEST